MAVSDGALFLLVAQLLLYGVMYCNKQRIWRIIGCGGMIAVGLSAVMVEDTLPAFAFAGISAIVAGAKLFEDVASLTA